MTTAQTWLVVYLGINISFVVGFIYLARFLRRNGTPPDAIRAMTFSYAATVGIVIAGFFGVKTASALMSGEAMVIGGRRGKRSGDWVTKEVDYSEYINTVVFDAGATLVCVVGALGFMVMKRVACDPAIEPARKMNIAIWTVMTMFWTFILTTEGVVYIRYG